VTPPAPAPHRGRPRRHWVPVLRRDALPPGEAVRAWAEGTRVVVARLPDGEGCVAALDVCPHLGLPLAAFGRLSVERGRLVCPWHQWRFDLRTGRCEYASLYADDEIFSFQLEGDDRPAGEAAGRLQLLPARLRAGYVEVALR
jgi:nitrite reductase/ring-hydroxylating ferredoxin subunit